MITWAIVLFRGTAGGINNLSRNNWVFLTLSAFATGFSWLFYYKALQMGKASEVTAIDKGSIVFTILLSFIFLKEPEPVVFSRKICVRSPLRGENLRLNYAMNYLNKAKHCSA